MRRIDCIKGILIKQTNGTGNGLMVPTVIGAIVIAIGLLCLAGWSLDMESSFTLYASIGSIIGGVYIIIVAFRSRMQISNIPDIGADAKTATIRYTESSNSQYILVESDDLN